MKVAIYRRRLLKPKPSIMRPEFGFFVCLFSYNRCYLTPTCQHFGSAATALVVPKISIAQINIQTVAKTVIKTLKNGRKKWQRHPQSIFVSHHCRLSKPKRSNNCCLKHVVIILITGHGCSAQKRRRRKISKVIYPL